MTIPERPYKREVTQNGQTYGETNYPLLAVCPICGERFDGGYFVQRTYRSSGARAHAQIRNEVDLVNHVLTKHRDASPIGA